MPVHTTQILVAMLLVAATAGANPASAAPLGNKALLTFIAKNQDTPMEKKDFETTDDFRQRLGYLEQEFTVDFVPENSKYNKFYEYDADTQTLKVLLPASRSVSHGLVFDLPKGSSSSEYVFRDYNMYMLKSVSEKPRDYIGQTAMGVRRSVSEYRSQDVGVTVMNVPAKDLNEISVVLQLAPGEAKALTSNLAWRFTGKTVLGVWDAPRLFLNNKWVISSNHYKEASLNSTTSMSLKFAGAPVAVASIALVNKSTGETLKQFSVR